MHEFSLTKEIEDMDEGELRSTLDQFMEKHAENVTAYDDLESQIESYSESVEALEGDLETAQTYFADKAAEYTHLESGVIVERFSLAETIEMAGEAEEAQFSEPEADEADEATEESRFSERPEKGRLPSEDGKSQFSKEAEADVSRILGL
jgi:chromosome segregation ATPase